MLDVDPHFHCKGSKAIRGTGLRRVRDARSQPVLHAFSHQAVCGIGPGLIKSAVVAVTDGVGAGHGANDDKP
ncbi:hypothetical protein CR159_02065 [Pollutimonas subterranea]|uniref:Uncharacterized protein n=1 Tax=Pollutimonas subterranea TaxID=2045210 RepID=A0A2N4UA06_9BURK|nr:hypothetical protein [Pollutimonas subterranea]PLC51828.1 hypothetical protein CR159_02065 [Pollutimonas subterranea]